MGNKGIQRFLMLAVGFFCGVMLASSQVSAEEGQLITTVEQLTEAMMNAQDGDTILVGDIAFKPMPMGMMQVPKNLVFKSGKEGNAVFTNATFALNGTASDAAPLKVRFEGIDFMGDNAGNAIDTANPPNISSKIPDIMTTMCAGIFKMNLDVTYADCSFTGYHYGYGGVFNAIYSSDDNKNELRLTLENCRFTENAGNYGGAMYLIGLNHNITLNAKDCVFAGNGAATGGAVWAENAVVDMKNCRFSDNLYIESDVSKPAGGAMALYICDAGLQDCVFEGNTSAEGGAIYCEIAPFHTLVMRTCTLNGNKAPVGSSLSVVPGETNFSTEARAYLYFSSFANHEGDADLLSNDSITAFGCLFADAQSPSEEPSEGNGYCLSLPAAQASAKGYTANESGRIFVKDGEKAIPADAVAAAANGRFAEYAGQLKPGDFEASELTAEPVQTVEASEQTPEPMQTVEASEEAAQESAESITESIANDTIEEAAAGNKTGAIIAGILLFACLVGTFAVGTILFVRRKATKEDAPSAEKETSEVRSEDWITRVCSRPELKELLSARELEVLPLLLEGKSREQIAKTLFISESTVKKHASSIYAKMNVSGKAELIAKMACK